MTTDDMTTALLGHDLAIQLTVTDAFDGAARLLCDAQRFGFTIRSLRIDSRDDGLASVRMTLAVQPQADSAQICSRFARHVCVASIEAI